MALNGITINWHSIQAISSKNGVFHCRVTTCNTILGEGSNGNGESIVALKSFQKSNKNDMQQKSKENFRREYELLRSFKDLKTNDQAHPYIVSAYEFVSDNEKYVDYSPFYLMELGNRSLRDLLNDKSIKTGETDGCYSFGHCLTYLRQISSALHYLHHEGIVFKGQVKPIIHRDLKSSNILLFKEGTICKLCDFGNSRQVADSMTRGSGTEGWRAPEVIESHRYTIAADCFSLGAVIAETLFRTIPLYIGRYDDRVYDETDTEIFSKVNFFCEKPKVLYLSSCTFAENNTFQENMTRMQNLLKCLFCLTPSSRLTSTQALKELEEMTSNGNFNLLPLYGPLQTGAGPSQEANEDTSSTKTTISPPVSMFYFIKKSDGNGFKEKEMDRIKQVMEVMISQLNTLASSTKAPCTAKFRIVISKESASCLNMEAQIQQSRNDKDSIIQWCRDNEETCENKFAGWFVDDPCVRGLKFSTKKAHEDYMPDAEANNETAAMSNSFAHMKLNNSITDK